MSALKNLTHIAQPNAQELKSSTSGVTNISVHARVDYTLRFSTPAVYVVGTDPQSYSHITSHYIESLDNGRNVAFISCVSQLNNIQMRCRIVEQLFGEQLFDPEEPLSVSIINIIKKQPQSVSIVLEHSQCLSLQIVHEVCQLAQIAKKTNLDVQVLLIGSIDTGYLMYENALLFKDKVTVIQSDSAQLINLQSKLLKRPSGIFTLPKGVIYTAVFALIAGVLLAATYSLWQLDVVNFSSLPTMNQNEHITESEKLAKPVMANELLSREEVHSQPHEETAQAVPEDILNALNGVTTIPSKPTIEYATTDDVLAALTMTKQPEKQSLELLANQDEVLEVNEPLVPQTTASKWPSHQVYKDTSDGFVIQYGGFTKQSIKQEFINEFDELNYISYERLLAGRKMEVLTSTIYPTKGLAEQALENSSATLIDRGVWIKSVSAIKDEINAFESSQLK